jgi:hypothetical protein
MMENIMYKLLPETQLFPAQCIKRLSDNAFIPMSEDNTDYQAFLRWCEEGNTPLPADEVTE